MRVTLCAKLDRGALLHQSLLIAAIGLA